MKTRLEPRLNLSIIALCVVTVFAPASQAAFLNGNLLIAGVGPVTVTFDVIDFTPPVNPAGNGSGTFNILPGSTDSFAPLVGTQASVRDLNRNVVGVGTPTSYANFVTFAAQPGWSITLTTLLPGVFSSAACTAAPAAGQNCTPAVPGGSPFNLTNTTPTASTVSFTFLGTAVDSATPNLVSTVQGVFTSQFSNMSYQAVLAQLAGGGSVSNSDSASITVTAIPEPGTLSSFVIGGLLAAVSIGVRRFCATRQA